MSDPSPAREPGGRPDYPKMGERLRAARSARRLSLRELAGRLGVSPSLISQIETSRANPSVSTLYAIANELDVSLDELLFNDRRPTERPSAATTGREGARASMTSMEPVQRAATRQAIRLASGVLWQRLTTMSEPGIEFLHVTYEVGGASSPPNAFQRHPGHEWGCVLSGRLQVRIGFEEYTLEPGDAISINSSIPHRLATIGDEPVEAIWFVLGRAQFDAQTLIDEHVTGRD
jgi:transcriptional regulator with XRE-family HTH domain